MNRLAHWMMRLYPARWRKRYGDELDALLTDTGADVRVVADLAKGGVRMQFSTWSFAKLALVLGVGGLFLGGLGSYLVTPTYISTAKVRTEPSGEMMRRAEPLVLSRVSLATIINDPGSPLYTSQLKTQPLEDVIQRMRNDTRITPEASSVLDVAFLYSDPRKAQKTLAALIDRIDEVSGQLQTAPLLPAGPHRLDVIDAPSLPVRPLFPSDNLIALTGCLLGVSIAWMWLKFRKKRFLTWGFAISTVVMGLVGTIAVSILYELSWIDGKNLLDLQFRSTALISFQDATTDQIQTLKSNALSRTSLSSVINDPRLRLYEKELRTEPLEDAIQKMTQHLAITPVRNGSEYFTVSFAYGDRFKAQQGLQMMMNRLDEEATSLYGNLAGTQTQPPGWEKIAIVQPPSLDEIPIKPNRYVVAGMGGTAGLLLAALIALIRNRWMPEGDIPMDAVSE